jgi:hypothetical protein
MKRVVFLLCTMLGGWGLAGEAPKPPAPKELDALIQQLGAADFSEREDAQLKLAAFGENVRELLTKALKHSDPEVVNAAGRLLDKINRATVAVQVVDSAGKPVAEAPVTFSIHRRDGRNAMAIRRNETVNTGEDGWASTGDLEPGGGYMINLRCQMQNYVPAMEYQQSKELKIGRQEFKLTVMRFSQFKGVLLGKDRVPLVEAQLYLVPNNLVASLGGRNAKLMVRRAMCVTTDAQGQFAFEQVQPGDYVAVLMDDAKILFKSDVLHFATEETVTLNPLVTDVDPQALKRSDNVLKEDANDPAGNQ